MFSSASVNDFLDKLNLVETILMLSAMVFVLFIVINIISLLWRIPEWVAAQRNLAVAQERLAVVQTEYYRKLIQEKQ